MFKIQLGIPGCDNKITYLFKILGYEIYNDPEYIKTYHCHANFKRNYTGLIEPPYCHVFPAMPYSPLPHINDITISTYSFSKSNTDLYLNIPNNYMYNYIVYILVIKLYLKIKN